MPAAILPLFGETILGAVEESKLWIWEKENGRLKTTDCVEMLLRKEDSHHRIFRLQFGWKRYIEIVQLLYG